MESNQLKVVFRGDEYEARLVCSRLDNEGVESEVVGGGLASFAPHYAAAGGIGTVEVWVRECDFEKAIGILS